MVFRLSAVVLWAVASFTESRITSVADQEELYSTNAICRQNNCINPIFPGIQDLQRLTLFKWQAQPAHAVSQLSQFCGSLISYDVAVPSPSENATSLTLIAAAQDDAASTMYFYHLAGMGLEALDFKNPLESDNECVRAVHRMVCFTYFPKAQAGAQAGEPTQYLRPCRSCCQNYIQACGVQCCDESVSCVFDHEIALLDGTTQQESGYSEELGPSAFCTGGAIRGARAAPWLSAGLALLSSQLSLGGLPLRLPFRQRWMLPVAMILAASLLQGCALFAHATPAWEEKQSYLVDDHFVLPGKAIGDAVLNSCEVENIPKKLQCSGNGVCVEWMAADAGDKAQVFCQCNRDWADPECRTKRKSQMVAWLLSLFLGFSGAEYFYMGMPMLGALKLGSAGGFGLWWIMDIVRIGSAPVYANEHRLAYDLPHSVFVLLSLAVFAVLGQFLASMVLSKKKLKKEQNELLQQEEAAFHATRAAVPLQTDTMVGQPRKTTIRVPLPPYGTTVPDHVAQAGLGNPFSSYGAQKHAEDMWKQHQGGGEATYLIPKDMWK